MLKCIRWYILLFVDWPCQTFKRSPEEQECALLQTWSEVSRVGASVETGLATDQAPSAVDGDINAVHTDVLDDVLNGGSDLVGGERYSGEGRMLEQVIGEVGGEVGGHCRDDNGWASAEVFIVKENARAAHRERWKRLGYQRGPGNQRVLLMSDVHYE